MVDREEERRRDAAMRSVSGVLVIPEIRLGDLPPTLFWEQDKVSVQMLGENILETMTVGRIDYGNMYKRRMDGSPWPFYDLNYATGGSTAAEESWITLIERGNLWKLHHNEPLKFANLKEEADFFSEIGEVEEVRNPANELYSWRKNEVVEAIKTGLAHGFFVTDELFGVGHYVSAKRFKNEELGARVAKATLEGLGVTV
ncbi:MAG: hypothetical protein V4690_00045 [Patescibacteria group bacterium]